MKAVILAGGFGTRLAEETSVRPKPMVEIAGRPILWHIMKIYSQHGINDFIICLGYKGYVIKEYFANYFLHTQDVTFDMKTNGVQYHRRAIEPWSVTLVDTGEQSMTAGRLKRVAPYLDPKEPFCMTYGDGVSDVNITELVKFHKGHNKLATLTAVQPPGRYGALQLENSSILQFEEKPSGDGGWVNGGFFVLSPKVLEYIDGDASIWEKEPLENLAKERQLQAFFHHGFWQPMDVLRDKQKLEGLWETGNAPWKVWS